MQCTTTVLLVLCVFVISQIQLPLVAGVVPVVNGLQVNQFPSVGAAAPYKVPARRRQRFGQIRRNRYQRKRTKTRLTGRRKAGIKGHAIINGEYVETNRILLQRRTLSGIGYFVYGKPKIPVFIRAKAEMTKKYIAFQDPHLPPGEGYLVILRKIPPKITSPGLRLFTKIQAAESDVPYEAFHLQLGSSIYGSIDKLNVRRFAYNVRTGYSGRKTLRRKWLKKRRRRKWRGRGRGNRRNRFRVSRLPGSRKGRRKKWRGKRSPLMENDTNKIFDEPDSCYISHLNVTQVYMKLNGCGVFSPDVLYLNGTNDNHSYIGSDTDENQDVDFQYFM